MWSAKVWRNLPNRVGFYTKENRHNIPVAAGIYAWFVPLHLYREDCDSLLDLIHRFYFYDAILQESTTQRSTTIDFSWDSLDVQVEKRAKRNTSTEIGELWDQMMSDKEQKRAFSRALLEATVLMPPLYVGKADDLKARYEGHLSAAGGENNNFHNRFANFSHEMKLGLRITDLLFVCIRTEPDISNVLRKSNLNKLLEQMMLRLARPPFSIK